MLTGVAMLSLVACGDDAAPGDGGAPRDASTIVDASFDAGGDARQAPALVGPSVVYTGEETCFETRGLEGTRTYLWGDGERTETSEDRACHTWRFPARLLVSVDAEVDLSQPVTVVPRPMETPPSASSPMARAGERLFVANEDDDSVAVLDLESGERVGLLETCARPRSVAVDGDELAVTCQDAGALGRFDLGTLEALGEVELGTGSAPFGVVADPRGGAFVVTLQEAGAIAVVAAGEVVAVLDVSFDLRGISMSATGAALVTRWRGGDEGTEVHTLDLADVRSPRLVGTALLPQQRGIDSDTDNSGVPSFLDAVTITPSGLRGLVPCLKANNATGMHRTGLPLQDQTTARAMLSELIFEGEGELATEELRIAFDDLDHTSAIAMTPQGDRIFLAFLGAQRVVAIDAFAFDVIGSIGDVGVAPRGLLYDAERERLYVFATLDREVRAYDVASFGVEPEVRWRASTIEEEPLDAEVLRGKRIFATSRDPRMSRTSYLSCASCHLDGEGDNLVWDFTQRGEGLRNTIPLRGRAGTAQGPMHWTGNFDEVQDFENDIRGGQGGTGFLSDAEFAATEHPLMAPKAGRSEELDALATYVESLAGVGESPHEFDAATVSRGEGIFEASGCATCHSGDGYTDSAPGVRHDVGTAGEASGQRLGETLDGFDTPTLRGLWRSAPYLHDGRAATLREVLTTFNESDAHGTTSDLDEDELGALEAFLLTR